MSVFINHTRRSPQGNAFSSFPGGITADLPEHLRPLNTESTRMDQTLDADVHAASKFAINNLRANRAENFRKYSTVSVMALDLDLR